MLIQYVLIYKRKYKLIKLNVSLEFKNISLNFFIGIILTLVVAITTKKHIYFLK